MIGFIKHNLKSALQRDRFSKYLIYALGEIVLVVIGIMVALFINNQSNYFKDRKEEALILRSIQSDLLKSKSEIQQVVRLQRKTIIKKDSLISLFEYYQSGVDRDSLVRANEEKIGDYMFKGVFAWYRAEPITGTYDALIGSGKTEIILSKELKRKLAEFSTVVNSGFEDQDTATGLRNLIFEKQSKYVGSDVWKYGNKIREANYFFIDKELRKKAIHSLLNDRSFEGLLIVHRVIEGSRLNQQERLLKQTEELLSIIEKEIE